MKALVLVKVNKAKPSIIFRFSKKDIIGNSSFINI